MSARRSSLGKCFEAMSIVAREIRACTISSVSIAMGGFSDER
jgi:hypothetical protein